MNALERLRSIAKLSAAPRWLIAIALPIGLVALVSAQDAAPTTRTAAVKPVSTAPAMAAAVALDRKIIAAAKQDSEIMANLAYLSDVIGPRLTGSAALRRANEWAAEKMKRYGLTNVKQEGWILPAGWERGTATARIVEPNNGRSLHLASMGWTPGTKGKIVGDVVVVTARNSKDLQAYKGKLKNAIVLRGKPSDVRPITDLSAPPFPGGRGQVEIVDPPGKGDDDKQPKKKGGEPGAKRQGGRPDGANFGQMQAFRRELADFLRTEGAAVLLQDSAKPQGLLTMSGGWRGADRVSAPEPLPAAFVAHEHYALLYRLATRPAPARTRVEIDITNTFVPGPITVYNTVGEIKGI